MKLKELLDELTEKEFFNEFKRENPNTFFSAGFFIFDLESRTETIQLDFFLKEKNKIASFEHPFKETKIHEDEIKEMKEQSTDLLVDISNLEFLTKKIIDKNESMMKPSKIIAIIKDNQWNITCMDNALGIIRMKIDATTGEEISFDKGSLMEFARAKGGEMGEKYDKAKEIKDAEQSN